MSDEKRNGFNEKKPSTGYSSLKWDGSLDEEELLAQKCKAAPLFAALLNRAGYLGISIQDLCAHLSVSYPYFNQLRSGRRQVSFSTEGFLEASAKYLGLPRLTVLTLAGMVTVDDLEEEPLEVISLLPRAFNFVTEDPNWGHLIDSQVLNSPFEVRYLIVRLYEVATDTRVLPERLEPKLLAQGFKALNKQIDGHLGKTSSLKTVD